MVLGIKLLTVGKAMHKHGTGKFRGPDVWICSRVATMNSMFLKICGIPVSSIEEPQKQSHPEEMNILVTY